MSPPPSHLGDEIRKRGPFESPAVEAYLNLLRTASVLGAEFHRLFKAHGLSEPTYNVLRILRGHHQGAKEGASGPDGTPFTGWVPTSVIGEQLVAAVPDVTRLIDRLEDAGLVERSRDTRDRRVILVRILRPGLELLARLDAPVVELHDRQLAHMGPEELERLSDLLTTARKGGDRRVSCEGEAGATPGKASSRNRRNHKE